MLSSIIDDWSTRPPSRAFSTAVSTALQAPIDTVSSTFDVAIKEFGILFL